MKETKLYYPWIEGKQEEKDYFMQVLAEIQKNGKMVDSKGNGYYSQAFYKMDGCTFL